MNTFLEWAAEYSVGKEGIIKVGSPGWDFGPFYGILAELIQEGPEQTILHSWCRRHPTAKKAELLNSRARPPEVSPIEPWQARLYDIAEWCAEFNGLTEWDQAEYETRRKHIKNVSAKARSLAALIADPIAPEYVSKLCLRERGFLDVLMDGRLKLRNQILSGIFRSLADIADELSQESRPDSRPGTGQPEARALARHLAAKFRYHTGTVPREVIAALVCLRFPMLESPPAAAEIKDWLRIQ